MKAVSGNFQRGEKKSYSERGADSEDSPEERGHQPGAKRPITVNSTGPVIRVLSLVPSVPA